MKDMYAPYDMSNDEKTQLLIFHKDHNHTHPGSQSVRLKYDVYWTNKKLPPSPGSS